jgi:hypothetical protein
MTAPCPFARRIIALTVAGVLAAGSPAPASAAELQPQTARAFDAYAQAVEERGRRELSSGQGFLGSDFQDRAAAPAVRRRIVAGGVPVERVSERGRDAQLIEVPDGLINHWRGAILVPRANLDQVLTELQSPQTRRHVQDDVLESRVLWRRGDESQIFLKLMRKKIVTVTYNTEHHVRYVRLSPTTASSQSVSTRIAEVDDAGTPAEREKPVGVDRGFMWRLHSYWRYQQVPEGVIIELESLTLSRDIPTIIKFVAGPIIDAIARESMTRTLESVRGRLLAAGGGRADAAIHAPVHVPEAGHR